MCEKNIEKLLLLEYADLMGICVANLCMEKVCSNENLWFKKLLYDFDFLIPYNNHSNNHSNISKSKKLEELQELQKIMNRVDIKTYNEFYQYLSNTKYPKAAFEIIKDGTFLVNLVNYMGELQYYPYQIQEIPADYPLRRYLRRNLPNDITKNFEKYNGKFLYHARHLYTIKEMKIPQDLKKNIVLALKWKPKYFRKYEDFPL